MEIVNIKNNILERFSLFLFKIYNFIRQICLNCTVKNRHNVKKPKITTFFQPCGRNKNGTRNNESRFKPNKPRINRQTLTAKFFYACD